jgi:hypothetical protein
MYGREEYTLYLSSDAIFLARFGRLWQKLENLGKKGSSPLSLSSSKTQKVGISASILEPIFYLLVLKFVLRKMMFRGQSNNLRFTS